MSRLDHATCAMCGSGRHSSSICAATARSVALLGPVFWDRPHRIYGLVFVLVLILESSDDSRIGQRGRVAKRLSLRDIAKQASHDLS